MGTHMGKEYVFDTATDLGRQQVTFLEELLDGPTTTFLDEIGVQPGWRCLDVGAGGGSITRWLADRTGPTGGVVAVDLETDHLPEHPGVEVYRHDINDGLPVDGPFDLIHARLVLMHLSRREVILKTFVDALAPGGWLVLMDGSGRQLRVLSAPSDEDASLFDRVMNIGMHHVVRGAGVSWEWAHDLDGHMSRAGLVDVHSMEYSRTTNGGTTGCLLNRNYILQLESGLRGAGVTEDELARYRSLMRDPRFRAWLFQFVFTRGRMP